jgi:GxxExxY protein
MNGDGFIGMLVLESGTWRTMDMDVTGITERIIGCALRVSNTLGCGFLEKVYENALTHEARKCGLTVLQQVQSPVFYDGVEVGRYVADLLVDHRVIVEVKATKAIDDIHKAQVLNYLRATNLQVGIILNFGTPRLGIRRLSLRSI